MLVSASDGFEILFIITSAAISRLTDVQSIVKMAKET